MRNPTQFNDDDNDIERLDQPLLAPGEGEEDASTATADKGTAATGNRRKRKHGDSAGVPSNTDLSKALLPSLVPAGFEGPLGQKFYTTKSNPMNRTGFRYVTCAPAPCFTPVYPLYRLIESPPVGNIHFSWEDRSPYVYISEDAKSIAADKGFRSARATVPIREGTWYFEIQIERGGGDTGTPGMAGAHVRVGIGRRESSLNAPVGIDGYSYGIRDKTGETVHLAQPTSYGESFRTGDVIGVLVHLPAREPSRHSLSLTPDDPTNLADPSLIVRKRVPIRYKGQLYFELLEYSASKEMTDMADAIMETTLVKPVKAGRQKAAAPGQKYRAEPSVQSKPSRPVPRLKGSAIYFFKNGRPMGKLDALGQHKAAFEDLFDWLPLRQQTTAAEKKKRQLDKFMAMRENHNDDGTIGYYPFVSVFGGGIATLNPGPVWLAQPNGSPNPDKVGEPTSWRPLCDRLAEYMAEERKWDEIEEKAAEPMIAQAEEAAKKAAEQEAVRQAQAEKNKARKANQAKSQGNSRASSAQASAAAELMSRRNSDRSRSATPVALPVSIPSIHPQSTMLPAEGALANAAGTLGSAEGAGAMDVDQPQ